MPSSPKKRQSTTSPTKAPKNEDVISGLQAEIQHLQFQLGERDIEIERMKTTLIALNEKVAVTSDIKNDCDEHKGYLDTSENERKKLQNHIVDASVKIKEEQEKNSETHNQHIKEIEDLRDQLQKLKQ